MYCHKYFLNIQNLILTHRRLTMYVTYTRRDMSNTTPEEKTKTTRPRSRSRSRARRTQREDSRTRSRSRHDRSRSRSRHDDSRSRSRSRSRHDRKHGRSRSRHDSRSRTRSRSRHDSRSRTRSRSRSRHDRKLSRSRSRHDDRKRSRSRRKDSRSRSRSRQGDDGTTVYKQVIHNLLDVTWPTYEMLKLVESDQGDQSYVATLRIPWVMSRLTRGGILTHDDRLALGNQIVKKDSKHSSRNHVIVKSTDFKSAVEITAIHYDGSIEDRMLVMDACLDWLSVPGNAKRLAYV
jgi:hypothetical protein